MLTVSIISVTDSSYLLHKYDIATTNLFKSSRLSNSILGGFSYLKSFGIWYDKGFTAL